MDSSIRVAMCDSSVMMDDIWFNATDDSSDATAEADASSDVSSARVFIPEMRDSII